MIVVDGELVIGQGNAPQVNDAKAAAANIALQYLQDHPNVLE